MTAHSRIESEDLRTLYPAIEPFDTFRMKVDEIHEIAIQQAGNPSGEPVTFSSGPVVALMAITVAFLILKMAHYSF